MALKKSNIGKKHFEKKFYTNCSLTQKKNLLHRIFKFSKCILIIINGYV